MPFKCRTAEEVEAMKSQPLKEGNAPPMVHKDYESYVDELRAMSAWVSLSPVTRGMLFDAANYMAYLAAQESLLEEWQQRAKRAEDAIVEMQRPLDAQMARLNARVVDQNLEIERLNRALSDDPDRRDAERYRKIRHALLVADSFDVGEAYVRMKVVGNYPKEADLDAAVDRMEAHHE